MFIADHQDINIGFKKVNKANNQHVWSLFILFLSTSQDSEIGPLHLI